MNKCFCLRRWCLWLLWGLLVSGPVCASHRAESVPLHAQAYWIDTSGQATVQDMAAVQDWRSHTGALALGFTAHPVWLKLEVDRQVQGLPWYWRVLPSYLDDVRLYAQDETGRWLEHRTGDLTPFHERRTTDLALTFPWQAPSVLAEPVRVYIRVQSSSTLVAHVQLLSPQAWLQARDAHGLMSGMMLGVIALVVVWAVFQAVTTRESIFVYYAVYAVCSLMMALGLLGYAAAYLFPESSRSDFFTSLMVILATMTGWAFHRHFLQPFMSKGQVRWLIDPALGLSTGTLLLLPAGYQQEAMMVINYTIVVYSLLVLPAVLLMKWPRLQSVNRRLLACYLIFPLGIVFTLLPNLGWATAGTFTGYGGVVHSLLVTVVLAIMLAMRQQNAMQAVGRLREEAAAAHAQAEMVRKERDEKDRFFAMLSHELRTPLLIIKMVLEGQQLRHGRLDALDSAQRAVDDIGHVVDLAMQVDRLEQGRIEPQRLACSLSEIVQSIQQEHVQGQRLHLQIHPDTPLMHSDPMLLRTIVSNLLENALKYSPRDSQVRVELMPAVHALQAGVQVRVHNRLRPGDAPDPQRMASKYYRSQEAHRVSGSGLGLYVVDGLVRMLGGDMQIALDSERSEISLHVDLPA